MEKLDIYSKGEYPANALSNFFPHAFVFDGVACGSMEGFLQALKYKDPSQQREICACTGKEAKAYGQGRAWWKLTGCLWWQGKRYFRTSKAFAALVLRAYEALYAQNADFRAALAASRGRELCHSIGGRFRRCTILTEKEFVGCLNALRRGGDLPS